MWWPEFFDGLESIVKRLVCLITDIPGKAKEGEVGSKKSALAKMDKPAVIFQSKKDCLNA